MAFIPERITLKVASVMMFSLPGHISSGGCWTCPVARRLRTSGHEPQSDNQATDDEIQMLVAKAETDHQRPEPDQEFIHPSGADL